MTIWNWVTKDYNFLQYIRLIFVSVWQYYCRLASTGCLRFMLHFLTIFNPLILISWAYVHFIFPTPSKLSLEFAFWMFLFDAELGNLVIKSRSWKEVFCNVDIDVCLGHFNDLVCSKKWGIVLHITRTQMEYFNVHQKRFQYANSHVDHDLD